MSTTAHYRLPPQAKSDSRLALLALTLQSSESQLQEHINKQSPVILDHLDGMHLIEARRLLEAMGAVALKAVEEPAVQIIEDEPHESENILLVAPALSGPAWPSLVLGFLGACLIFFLFPLLEYGLSFILVPVHEMGHAIAYWLYGYPSIPAFDFNYGGGVTMHQERNFQVFWGLILAELFGTWHLRRYPHLQRLAIIFVTFQLGTAFFSIHEVIGLAAGHAMELIIMGVFLYRAIAGVSIVAPGERVLYCMVGTIMWLHSIRFAYQLLSSEEHRYLYEEAKGGGHWMDFSRIAEEYANTSLQTVALIFLLGIMLAPFLAWIAAIFRAAWLPWLFRK